MYCDCKAPNQLGAQVLIQPTVIIQAGVNVGLVDGSVRFVSETINNADLAGGRAASTAAARSPRRRTLISDRPLRIMRYNWPLTCLFVLVLGFGCPFTHPTTVGLHGEVTYEGKAVEKGKINFVPVDKTPGPSAVATIAAGRYDVPARWGLLPDGVYVVRITAFSEERKDGAEPHRAWRAARRGRRRLHPRGLQRSVDPKTAQSPIYNRNTADFNLSKPPAVAPR